MKMKKSQFGIEFIYFVGVAMVILILYLALSSSYFSATLSRRDKIESANLLEQIRSEINNAGRVENGYMHVIKIPKNINNKDYNLTIKGREIFIEYPKGSNDVYARILSTDVINKDSLGNPIQFDPGKSYYILKENDDVKIAKQ